jgi:RNA polymerase sigma-70 factor (ECF subfamily)
MLMPVSAATSRTHHENRHAPFVRPTTIRVTDRALGRTHRDAGYAAVLTMSMGPDVRSSAGSARGMALDRDGSATLGRLYEEHADAVFRALRRWGVRDSAADDALQEVFLIASRKLAEFEGRSSHRTWLFGIALRVARGVRRARAHETIGDEEPEGHDAPLDEKVDALRAARLLDRLLAELDDAQREVFVMADLHDLSAPEIAEITGANVNTVYSRLRLARQSLAAAVARSGSTKGRRSA